MGFRNTRQNRLERAYQPILDAKYSEMGPFRRTTTKVENEKYDVVVGKWKVEEKGEEKFTGNLAFEEWQDYMKNKGWVYKTRADKLVYLFWRDWETIRGSVPENIYIIDWVIAHAWYRQQFDTFDNFVSDKGWGNTWGKKVPISRMSKEGCIREVRLDEVWDFAFSYQMEFAI